MMKTVKRWTSSIVASVDSMISQIENHEALVNAAIREVQDSAAKARLHHVRVLQDGQRMRKRLIELRDAADLWSERAKKSAREDEKRALECLRRRKRLDTDLRSLEEQERTHARLERQLADDLRHLEEKLTLLRQQRNIMRTRESRAQAISLLRSDDSRLISEIDDIFDRWEAKLAVYETHPAADLPDALEEEFLSQEEEQLLRDELSSLLEVSAEQ